MKNKMTEVQHDALQEGLRGHPLEPMLLLAMVLGLRRDELRRLTWSEVDLQIGELHILHSKTKGHVRCIHVSEDLLYVLGQHALCQVRQNREADTIKPRCDLVFPESTGDELSRERFLQEWHACCEDVGLPRLRFHDLRTLVWRRLLLQEREGTNDAGNNHPSGEEPYDGHA